MDNTQTVTNVSIEWMLKNLDSFIDGYSMCRCPEPGEDYCPNSLCAYEDMIPNWTEMVEWKAWECTDGFIESILREGIRNPICLMYNREGKWVHGNGHHRTAIAVLACLEYVPVIFAFDGDYMHSDLTGEYEGKACSGTY